MFFMAMKKTFWLTLTNLALGLAVLLFLLTLFGNIIRDMLKRRRASLASRFEREDYLHDHEELGARMADGGEKLQIEKPVQSPDSQSARGNGLP